MNRIDENKLHEHLVAEIEELNKRDREAIARAKLEREKWLEEKRRKEKTLDQD
ncbi:MAG: hypothetical protein ACR2PB_13280 [Desulfocapsaceae bacterium]